jgi:uncharacterized membrane protein YidH (DUF202 family)
MSAGATREERRRDAVALGLLAGGVAFFVVAFIGFQRLPARTHALRPGEQAYPIFLRYFILTAVGLALVLAGLGTAVWSYVRRQRAQVSP